MDVYSARLLGKAAAARQEKFLGPAWRFLAVRRKGDQEKRWSHRQHTIQTKPFGEEKVGTGHVDTKKNISVRCKWFVRNTRMDFGALKAVLFLHSMGISWEQKAAFMWRTHHFRAHITFLLQNPQNSVKLKVRIQMNSLEFIFIGKKQSKSWEAH